MIGTLASSRDIGSNPHTTADLAALAAAAFAIGLRFDALAARRSESHALQRWEAVFSAAAIGMSVVGPDGIIREINDAAAVIFGRTPGDPIAVATVRRDMREQIAAQRRLESTVRQRSQLLTELLAAEQNERERIAEVVHDESVQLLANQVRRDRNESTGEAIADITDLVVNSLDHLRRLLADLHPVGDTDGDSLADSLRAAAVRLFAGTQVRVTIEGTLTDVPPEVVGVLDRGAREALSNARRRRSTWRCGCTTTPTSGGSRYTTMASACPRSVRGCPDTSGSARWSPASRRWAESAR